jgi:hypothetical protein
MKVVVSYALAAPIVAGRSHVAGETAGGVAAPARWP